MCIIYGKIFNTIDALESHLEMVLNEVFPGMTEMEMLHLKNTMLNDVKDVDNKIQLVMKGAEC